MFCPNCNELMHFAGFDHQIIRHCANCGASFFEENSINRISLSSAEKLASDRQTNIIIGQKKLCPLDQTPLSQVPPQESIPDTVSLFRCNKCRGIFSYPDDLVNFKKAQSIKVDYFKIWSKPLPSLKAVLVYSFLAFFSVATILTGLANQKNVTQSQAKNLIGTVHLSSSNRFLFITFTTSVPVKSEVKFFNKKNKTSFDQIISSTAKTVHSLTSDKINFQEEYSYQIILTDFKGNKIPTEEKPLDFKAN